MKSTLLHKGRRFSMKQKTQFTLGEVARQLGVKPYKINYALITGLVPEPETRIFGKRIFGPKDVERLARYFETKEAAK